MLRVTHVGHLNNYLKVTTSLPLCNRLESCLRTTVRKARERLGAGNSMWALSMKDNPLWRRLEKHSDCVFPDRFNTILTNVSAHT